MDEKKREGEEDVIEEAAEKHTKKCTLIFPRFKIHCDNF